ncbi:HNH endonuclease family protein [Burkholderia cepacia]|uniref:HNH endonuclease family protein n=1 Tax=Burkholderia cepacia TaxID=292 RepID=UPI001CF3282B|nr:HNH endonuclease family protein [Burkholderia cepacia]MCA7902621.1 HNH endonuclease family protein [Burkholderia cepacia]
MIQDLHALPVSFYFSPDGATSFFIPKYQREYRNGLYLNADLASRSDWNEAAIAARTDKLLKEVKSILSLREDK